MEALAKKTIAIFVISLLLAISFFSLALILHKPGQDMSKTCPFSSLDQELCPQNTLAVTIHHLLAYHSFLNIPLNSNFTWLLIIALLYLAGVGLIISQAKNPLGWPLRLLKFDHSPPCQGQRQKIIHWLALLENSPGTF